MLAINKNLINKDKNNMKKSLKIIVILLISVFWMFGIYKLSSMTSNNSNSKSTDIISIFIEDTLEITNSYGITSSHPNEQKIEKVSQLINAPMRKVIHATVYFILAFFIMILMNIIFDHKKYFWSVLITLILCIIFAGFDEYHQTFVAGRTGQLLDVIIDTAGGIIGILFYSTYQLVYVLGYKKAVKEHSCKNIG